MHSLLRTKWRRSPAAVQASNCKCPSEPWNGDIGNLSRIVLWTEGREQGRRCIFTCICIFVDSIQMCTDIIKRLSDLLFPESSRITAVPLCFIVTRLTIFICCHTLFILVKLIKSWDSMDCYTSQPATSGSEAKKKVSRFGNDNESRWKFNESSGCIRFTQLSRSRPALLSATITKRTILLFFVEREVRNICDRMVCPLV